jgi:hypothetical protein
MRNQSTTTSAAHRQFIKKKTKAVRHGRGAHVLSGTPSIPNYKTFDFFDTKFDHSSYSKICAKYKFFYRGLVY